MRASVQKRPSGAWLAYVVDDASGVEEYDAFLGRVAAQRWVREQLGVKAARWTQSADGRTWTTEAAP